MSTIRFINDEAEEAMRKAEFWDKVKSTLLNRKYLWIDFLVILVAFGLPVAQSRQSTAPPRFVVHAIPKPDIVQVAMPGSIDTVETKSSKISY